MKVLLDTHVLLWWMTDDARLPADVRALIADAENDVLVSAASAWEIATKHRLGKLGLADAIVQQYSTLLTTEGFATLPISSEHALLAGSYPQAHRDPFDRMLAAQAEVEQLALLSSDPALEQFGVDIRWSGIHSSRNP